MKNIEIRGRKIPIVAILIGLLVIGTATAALVTTFVQHDTEVDVTAPLYLDDDTFALDLVAGETYEFVAITVNSNASVPTLAEIVTEIDDGVGIGYHYTFDGKTLGDIDNDGYPELLVPALSDGEELMMKICTSPALEAKTYIIETHFTPAEGVGMLVLEDKDSSWAPNKTNDIGATLIFGTSEDEFSYYLTGTVKDVETEYTLIYYADKPDRFNNWGGDNPGALIGTETSDGDGSIDMSGSIDLGMNLPHENDANFNMDETDYREAPDFYCNGFGAKIWLVQSSSLNDYPNNPWTDWSPGEHLFETDLIQYTDADLI